MSLVMRKTSKWWYGRYKIDGKEFVKNLQVEIRGVRPASLKETGSVHFENSRGEAQSALNNLIGEVRSGKSETKLAEAVYEARAGKKLTRHKTKDLSSVWKNKPRKRPPSKEHSKQVIGKLDRLTDYLAENFPSLTYVEQLRHEHIKAFLDGLESEGLTAETWNKYLITIKSVLRRAGSSAADDIILKEVETIFREPYSIDELNAIFDAAKSSDELIYHLAVTAATTAMRRKDCCFLSWDSVDFADGFITVKTSKTGVTVDIPMADLLLDVLKAQEGNKSEYVFPEAKALYESDPTAITRRFKQVLRIAGFGKDPVEYKSDDYSVEELVNKAHELYVGKKLKHVVAVVENYCSGLSMKRSAEAASVTISTASLYLNDLEEATGKAIIRGKMRKVEGSPKSRRGEIQRERKNGKLAASIRDFHSFRTTWVTLALMNGMPIETVRKVTGHKTADIVTKHYFKPHRAELKRAMQKTLPGMLTASAKNDSPTERARDVLQEIDWKGNKASIRKVVDDALAILESSPA
jgi:integrase